MTTARTCAWSAASFGGRPVRWMGSPPTRCTWMSRWLQAAGRPCRWRRRATPSHTFSRGVGSSATPPAEADNRSLVLFDRGDELTVQAGEDGIRFLLVSGQPLEEPVAWYGPI